MSHPAIVQQLDDLERAGLRRRLRETEWLDGCRVSVEGRQAISFGSCDYLGLARHPRLAAAAAGAAQAHGTGSGSARLISGHTGLGAALERELAAHFDAERALVFGAGYLANLGVITALAGPGDRILSDRLNHRSVIDACRLSGAEVSVFEHNDVADLERLLAVPSAAARTLVVVEGVDSMEGDAAPLAALADACEAASALLVVDDAHGFGARGEAGRGSAHAEGVGRRVAVRIGNLGKALGSYGAFVLADDELCELLTQRARSFVFSCALPPPVLAAARESLALLASEPERCERLRTAARTLRHELHARGVTVLGARDADTPIVPVPIVAADPNAAVLALSEALLAKGWLVPAIRPPTVPAGTARLRLTVTVDHTPEHLAGVAADLAELLA